MLISIVVTVVNQWSSERLSIADFECDTWFLFDSDRMFGGEISNSSMLFDEVPAGALLSMFSMISFSCSSDSMTTNLLFSVLRTLIRPSMLKIAVCSSLLAMLFGIGWRNMWWLTL